MSSHVHVLVKHHPTFMRPANVHVARVYVTMNHLQYSVTCTTILALFQLGLGYGHTETAFARLYMCGIDSGKGGGTGAC